MIKINIKFIHSVKNVPSLKIILLIITIPFITSFILLKHPVYISVVDIKHNVEQKSIHVSIKLFTTDLEDALKKSTKNNIDVLNPSNKTVLDTIIYNYVKKRLIININYKLQKLSYIGYEKEDESIWIYLEIQKVLKPKTINIDTKILYDYLPNEVNIVHTEINAIKKSLKVTNPESKISLNF